MDRLFHGDVDGVGLRDWDLHVLRDGHGHGMRDRDSDLLHHRDVVGLRVLRVGVTFWFPLI